MKFEICKFTGLGTDTNSAAALAQYTSKAMPREHLLMFGKHDPRGDVKFDYNNHWPNRLGLYCKYLEDDTEQKNTTAAIPV